MTNAEICVRQVQVAAPETSVRTAARLMRERGVGSLVVVDALRRPLGIVTDRDLVVRCLATGRNADRTALRSVMSGPAAWVRENGAVDRSVEEMARLRRELSRVKKERDFLKEAAVFFASESR